MKRLIIILSITISACTSGVNTRQQKSETANEQEKASMEVPLNKGSKWKADQATKENVSAMVRVVNDGSYSAATNKMQLYTNLQTKIDTLVKQCNMQGADHEALHVWLKNILKDMKELKEEDEEYNEAYAILKKDIESFDAFFE